MTVDNISVIKIRDTLMVTVPTDLDDATISNMQEHILHAMEKYNPKGLVLDLTEVETLDSYFARTVAETAQMVGLMGGKTIIAGMQPSVAITATQLGLTMGAAETALDVDTALDELGRIDDQE